MLKDLCFRKKVNLICLYEKYKNNTLYGKTQNADCGYGRAKC